MIHSLLRNKDTLSSHLINAYFQDIFIKILILLAKQRQTQNERPISVSLVK